MKSHRVQAENEPTAKARVTARDEHVTGVKGGDGGAALQPMDKPDGQQEQQGANGQKHPHDVGGWGRSQSDVCRVEVVNSYTYAANAAH